MNNTQLPLCIDLDGTFLRTDVISEAMVQYLRGHPMRIFKILGWLFKGRAHMKAMLARHVILDIKTLPINHQVLDLINEARNRGQKVILVTAADARIANAVAKMWPVFDEVMASDGVHNLRAHAKADALVKKFGEKQFIYAGNAKPDLPVWAVSAEAIAVNLTAVTRYRLHQLNVPTYEIVEDINRDFMYGLKTKPVLLAPLAVAILDAAQGHWSVASLGVAITALFQSFYFLYFIMRVPQLRELSAEQQGAATDFATCAIPMTFAMKSSLVWLWASLEFMNFFGSLSVVGVTLFYGVMQALLTMKLVRHFKKFMFFSGLLLLVFLIIVVALA